MSMFSYPIHELPFVFHKRMNVPLECNRGVFVSENFGQGFHIHTTLNRASRTGMSERMKAVMGYFLFFQEQFEAALIGTNRNGFTAVSCNKP